MKIVSLIRKRSYFLALRHFLKKLGIEVLGSCCPNPDKHTREEIISTTVETINLLLKSKGVKLILVDLFLIDEETNFEQPLISVEIINELSKENENLKVAFMTDSLIMSNVFYSLDGVNPDWNFVRKPQVGENGTFSKVQDCFYDCMASVTN